MPKIPNRQLLTKICKHQYRNPISLAQQWQKDLAEGKYRSRADLSRKMGVSRARVTQIMNLLELSPEAIKLVSSLGDSYSNPMVAERRLRPLLGMNAEEQIEQIQLLRSRGTIRLSS